MPLKSQSSILTKGLMCDSNTEPIVVIKILLLAAFLYTTTGLSIATDMSLENFNVLFPVHLQRNFKVKLHALAMILWLSMTILTKLLLINIS